MGVAISYGIYDPQANCGHLFVGTSYDTSEFAGDALAPWWNHEGRDPYPDADRILILADCGGSGRVGASRRPWEGSLTSTVYVLDEPPVGPALAVAASARSRGAG